MGRGSWLRVVPGFEGLASDEQETFLLGIAFERRQLSLADNLFASLNLRFAGGQPRFVGHFQESCLTSVFSGSCQELCGVGGFARSGQNLRVRDGNYDSCRNVLQLSASLPHLGYDRACVLLLALSLESAGQERPRLKLEIVISFVPKYCRRVSREPGGIRGTPFLDREVSLGEPTLGDVHLVSDLLPLRERIRLSLVCFHEVVLYQCDFAEPCDGVAQKNLAVAVAKNLRGFLI